jgi:LysM repeat protein
MRMTTRISSVVSCGALILAAWFSPFATAQDTAPAGGSVQDELRSLRQLIEQQSKQIDSLSAQITRLGGELERRNLATPAAPLPDANKTEPENETAPAAAPAPKVVNPPANVHIVVKGDSLDKIAKQNNTTIAELQKLNKIADPKKLQIGQQLTLPPKGDAGANPAPTPAPAPAPEKKEGQ